MAPLLLNPGDGPATAEDTHSSLQLMAYPMRLYCRVKALVTSLYLFTVKTVCLHGESEMDGLSQGWAISGPRATCGLPQRFQWPEDAFSKNL